MTQRTAITKRRGPKLRYVVEVINELKKVVWLSRQEVTYLTTLVLIVTIIFAIVLGTLDFAFSRFIDTFFGGG